MADDQTKKKQEFVTQGKDHSLPIQAMNPQHHLDLIGSRIADPKTSVQDAIILTQICGELVRQEEDRKDREHARVLEKRQFFGKMAFSAGAVCAGLGLIGTGMHLEGFAIMGIGFHWLAPDFVKSIYDRILGKGGNQNGK